MGGNYSISQGLKKTNYSGKEEFASTALRAIEVDFQCASYCTDTPSRYRAFSFVKNGPVAHNCTSAINTWLHDTSKANAGLYWAAFGVLTFTFAYVIAFACRKQNEMESPLLYRHNNWVVWEIDQLLLLLFNLTNIIRDILSYIYLHIHIYYI